jgi:hypothetical protein
LAEHWVAPEDASQKRRNKLLLGEVVGVDIGFLEGLLLGFLVGALVEIEDAAWSQHPSWSPLDVGQHSPSRPRLAHAELAEHWAGLEDAVGEWDGLLLGEVVGVDVGFCEGVLLGFLVVRLVGIDIAAWSQHPSWTPFDVGQHSPSRPRLAHAELAEHVAPEDAVGEWDGLLLGEVVGVDAGFVEGLLLGFLVGRLVGIEDVAWSQHPSWTPVDVGQHSPSRLSIAHAGLAEHWAGPEDEVGEWDGLLLGEVVGVDVGFFEGMLLGFLVGGLVDVDSAAWPQHSSWTPPGEGQHWPLIPRLAHIGFSEQSADPTNAEGDCDG